MAESHGVRFTILNEMMSQSDDVLIGGCQQCRARQMSDAARSSVASFLSVHKGQEKGVSRLTTSAASHDHPFIDAAYQHLEDTWTEVHCASYRKLLDAPLASKSVLLAAMHLITCWSIVGMLDTCILRERKCFGKQHRYSAIGVTSVPGCHFFSGHDMRHQYVFTADQIELQEQPHSQQGSCCRSYCQSNSSWNVLNNGHQSLRMCLTQV